VQRAGDPRALQRLRRRVLLADRHQAGHLVLGEADLVTPVRRERQVGHREVDAIELLQMNGHECDAGAKLIV
jgi:hypothetical protein